MLQNKKRIWIVSELFYPEQTSTGYFLTEIAKGLSSDFDVRIICGQPTYSEHGIKAPNRENWHNMLIFRLPATTFKKDRLFLRSINALTLSISLIVFLLFTTNRGDKILLVTNPPTFTPILAFVTKLKRFKSFLLVHDVYPEILHAVGFLKKKSLIYQIADKIMTISLTEFRKIIVLGRDMKGIVQRKVEGIDPEVIIIPNWADKDEIFPVDDDINEFLKMNNIIKNTIIQFSGNIGLTHDLKSILISANRTENRDDIKYVIAGFGGQRENVKKEISTSKAKNVLFLDRQPRELLGAMLSSATAVVIPFNPHMRGLSVPSRMYNVMAAGTPIIAMAEADTELALMVSENDAGWVIEPLNSEALTKLILYIASPEGKQEACRRGMNGRRAVCASYTFDQVLQRFQSVLSSEH